jgi:predicted dithiol-disulfide oxidoreductase (DUF899 family)
MMSEAEEIARLEQELREKRERLIALKKQLAGEPVRDYTLKSQDGKSVRLSELFGKHDDLIVIHNMGASCVYCTMWADGFNGVVHHLENRAAFAVVSPDAPATQRVFAQQRGWKFKMCSGEGSTFIEDMGFKHVDGGRSSWMPGVSTFRRTPDGKIVRIGKDSLGPGDPYCSVWHLFDLLKDGANGWEPAYKYE